MRVKRFCKTDLTSYDNAVPFMLPLNEFMAQHSIPLVPYLCPSIAPTDVLLYLQLTQKGKVRMESAEIIQSLIK
jgi:hypothetical protein